MKETWNLGIPKTEMEIESSGDILWSAEKGKGTVGLLVDETECVAPL